MFFFCMDSEVQPWSSTVKIPSTVVHAVAILSTTFRLLYRWHLTKSSWEDGWAALALICDMACLASVWMQEAPDRHTRPSIDIDGNWLLSISITCIVWFARISILCSVVRIANPPTKLRRIAYCIGTMFLVMEAGLVAQKIHVCMMNLCQITNTIAIAQLITDTVSDITLVALPIWLLRGIKLPQDSRVLILSAFSASILISAVTILHSILLLQDVTSLTYIIGHVKAALALFVCNSLVIAIVFFRMWKSMRVDAEDSDVDGSNTVEFTSIIELPSKLSSHACPVSVVYTETRAPDMHRLPLGLATNSVSCIQEQVITTVQSTPS